MEISVRSYLAAGVSLTAATAIALTPLAIPEPARPLTIPEVAVAELELTAARFDIETLVGGIEALLDVGAADVAGIPGEALIGVANTIATLFDVSFGALIDATDDPTLVTAFTILQTLSVDAYLKLAENLGRINTVITGTTAKVGDNLASGDILGSVRAIGDAGFDIVGIAIDEVTFQFNNAVSRLSTLATVLGGASGNALVEAVIAAVQGLVVAPVVAVVNLGSDVAHEVLTAVNVGFDVGLHGVSDAAFSSDAAFAEPARLVNENDVANEDTEIPAPSEQAVAVLVDDDAPVYDESTADEVVTDDAGADEAVGDEATGDEDEDVDEDVPAEESPVENETVETVETAEQQDDGEHMDRENEDGGSQADRDSEPEPEPDE